MRCPYCGTFLHHVESPEIVDMCDLDVYDECPICGYLWYYAKALSEGIDMNPCVCKEPVNTHQLRNCPLCHNFTNPEERCFWCHDNGSIAPLVRLLYPYHNNRLVTMFRKVYARHQRTYYLDDDLISLMFVGLQQNVEFQKFRMREAH